MSLNFSVSIGPEGKKESSFGVTASLSLQQSTLNITAPTLSFTSQVAPADGGSIETSFTGGFTTPSFSSAASE
jgi:hypothetical protein